MNRSYCQLPLFIAIAAVGCAAHYLVAQPAAADSVELGPSLQPIVDLEQSRRDPPRESGVRCWWWLNGNVTKAAITRDLEAMHDKGFCGAMIFDADGSSQKGNRRAPEGPMFGSVGVRGSGDCLGRS